MYSFIISHTYIEYYRDLVYKVVYVTISQALVKSTKISRVIEPVLTLQRVISFCESNLLRNSTPAANTDNLTVSIYQLFPCDIFIQSFF